MKFLDLAKVHVRSGGGGGGAVSFRREKFVEYGGPDGGDGGRGGDVTVVAVEGLNTLIDFRYQQHFFAKSGQGGMGRGKTGRDGDGIVLRVPVGTEVLDEDQETVIADMDTLGQSLVLARGGNGGFGNAYFKTSTNQAPRRANPGQEGVERTIWLRLKLIADVGLLGLPNAGKSTFLAATSNARPKVADYPFTTLVPNLGVVAVDGAEFVVADIPGLIAGASEGTGLGDRFLGHVERSGALLHLVDGTSEDVAADWRTIVTELDAYGGGLAAKPRLTVLNKCDALEPEHARRAARGAGRGGRRAGARHVGRVGRGRGRGAARAAGDDRRARRDGGGWRGRGAGRVVVAGLSAGPRTLEGARRVVVKVGSALLVERETGRLRSDWLAGLAADVAALRALGVEVVVVSSGSIALGRRTLSLPADLALEQSQAAAAVGQIRLAAAYGEALAPLGIVAAQVLLTLDDSEDRRRYLNMRATFETLLSLGVVPIVNENDTVATDEIRFGDNDRLAAQVAAMAGADVCVLLSDVDGLYTANPQLDPGAAHLPVVEAITEEIAAMAGEGVSGLSKGGMITKVMAARTATEAGCALVITQGGVDRPLRALSDGARATWFAPKGDPQAARKRWIGSMKPRGTIAIDAGARDALRGGRSLLPAGVTFVGGSFGRGDPVAIEGPDGRKMGQGLARYDAVEARAIRGLRSGDIPAALGYPGRAALIHRDDMVI